MSISGRVGLGAVALSGLLAGCGTTIGGINASWARDGSPVSAASDLMQCPDLTGEYRAIGQVISSTDASAPVDLHELLADRLTVRGLDPIDASPREATTAASVTLTKQDGEWRILSRDGNGGEITGRLPLLNGGLDQAPPEEARRRTPLGPVRYNGCSRGRLWIGSSSSWTQYESQTTVRRVGVMAADGDGLILDLLDERRTLALLPWASTSRTMTRYRFPRVQSAASPR